MSEAVSPLAPGAALVTGAARRIGRAIAVDLARCGWAVAVHYHRSHAEATAVVDEITGAGGRAALVHADLALDNEAGRVVPEAVAALGPLSCLINNASVFERDTARTVTPESWSKHLEINLHAPLVLTQAFAAQLAPGAAGNVINLLDQVVWRPTAAYASYTISKSALWTLTRTLAIALAPEVRVNGIGPGPALPNKQQSDEAFRAQARATPLGRRTTPAEICDAVRFILSAPAMTGQMIALDGGQHLIGSART